MMKQSEVYSDIGKMARDLLYRDYIQKLPMQNDQRWLDWSIQLLLQSKEIVPGLNAKLRFIAPYRRSSMVELRYFHGYTGITTGISLSKNPLLNFSGVLGNRFFSIGTGISFDTKTTFANCDAGLSFNSSIVNASLTLSRTDKGHSLNASSYLPMSFLNNSAFAAEITHRFLNPKTSITLGTQISPTPSMLIKTRVSVDGTVGGLLQKELFPSFFLTIEGQTNVKDAKGSARMGFSCALKYKMR